MPFTVKATYRAQTRKLSFPECNTFPSFDQLYHQLYRVFPISHPIILSKLLFSPDSSHSRLLISRELRTAEEYALAVAPYTGRAWTAPLLRFSVFDETPHKLPAISHTQQNQASHPQKPEILNPFPVAEPSFGRISYSHIPPPPIIFSSRPTQETVDVGNLETTAKPTVQQREPALCCSVARTKKEIQELISSFKVDLDRAISSLDSHAQGNPISSAGLADALSPKIPLQYNLCWSCGVLKQGPWFDCANCTSKLCHACSYTLTTTRHLLGEEATKESPSSLNVPFAVPVAESVSVRNEDNRVVHHDVWCDSCHSVIEGIRHKCLDCPDFDLCTPCIRGVAAETHNPFHEFFQISEPGRVVVHNVFSGHGEQEVQQPPPRPVDEVPVPPPQPVVHSATCDLCESRIYGDRYKCVTCPDWDCCGELSLLFTHVSCCAHKTASRTSLLKLRLSVFNCVLNSITEEQHPRHAFVKISRPADYIRRDTTVDEAHFATCNSCSRHIYGIRYKCMHEDCPDFDLCSVCEALPIAVHPAHHPLLKIKEVETAIPRVYRNNSRVDAVSVNLPGPPPVTPRAPSRFGDYESGFMRNPGLHTDDALSPEMKPPSPFYFQTQSVRSLTPEYQPSEIDQRPTAIPAYNLPSVSARSPSPAMMPGALPTFFNLPPIESLSLSSMLNTPPTTLPSIQIPQRPQPVEEEEPEGLIRTPSPLWKHTPYTRSQPKESLTGTLNAPVVRSESLTSSLSSSEPLNAEFVADRTLACGQVLAPGAEFSKAWVMRNSGSKSWPEGTQLVFVAGESLGKDNTSMQPQAVGIVQPDEQIDVWTGELKAPGTPGRYVSYYRLRDDEGNLFGHNLWLDISVSQSSQRDTPETSTSEGYLSSSSIMVMPQRAPIPSAVSTDDQHDTVDETAEGRSPDSSVAVSPMTARSVDDEAEISDADSDTTGSLLSVPDSDSDEELWQDSRTTQPSDEYVVLYDDATSSEEED
ncbi:hypothetical protein F5880DRAFT_1470735 [Lentinula raphanica]|nr:hypothetical protein F5880DRAFT_1470735 [Lentinula raphanica]